MLFSRLGNKLKFILTGRNLHIDLFAQIRYNQDDMVYTVQNKERTGRRKQEALS